MTVSEPIEEWLELMPSISITNNKLLIEKIITKKFKEIAGLIEYEHFRNAENIICGEINDSFFAQGESTHEALFTWLVWLEYLLSDLWFIKDNTVVCEVAFCSLTDQSSEEWTKNSLVFSTFLSTGESMQTVDFSIEQLKQWNKKSEQIQAYLFSSNSTFKDSFTNTNFSRLGRSLRFIKAASRERHPAVKLAQYCSALESLFSTDSSELSHKLSERVAWFLKQYGHDPIVVYDEIKSFYNVRSKVIHGDTLKTNKEQTLPNMSKKCDEYLRIILNSIFDTPEYLAIFDGKQDSFDHYFKDKLLNG